MDDGGQTSNFLGTKAIPKIGNLQYTYSARLQYILIPTTTKNKWVLCVYADVLCYFFPLKMAFGFSRDLKCSRDFQTSQRVTFQEIKVSLFLSGIWICMNSRQNYRHSIIKIQIKCNFPILHGTIFPFLKPCAHPPIFHSLKFSN